MFPHYTSHGKGPRKAIFIHGWLGDSTSFARLADCLDPDLMECAFIDARGYGANAQSSGPFDIRTLAADCHVLAQSLDWSDIVVVGHSMGAKAALALASRDPSLVAGIVAVTPVPPSGMRFPADTRALFEAAPHDESARKEILRFTTADRLSPHWLSQAILRARSGAPEAIAAYFCSWADENLAETARCVRAPTLALVGEFDPAITAALLESELRPIVETSKIETLAGCGHYPADECPAALAAVIERFCASLP